MMYFDEILQDIGLPMQDVANEVKVVILGHLGAFVQGFQKIEHVDTECISVRKKNQVYVFEGKNLQIKGLSKTEMQITGEITAWKKQA